MHGVRLDRQRGTGRWRRREREVKMVDIYHYQVFIQDHVPFGMCCYCYLLWNFVLHQTRP